MGKIVRLTESELVGLVKKILKESEQEYNATTSEFLLTGKDGISLGTFKLNKIIASSDRLIAIFTTPIKPGNVGQGTTQVHYKCSGDMTLGGNYINVVVNNNTLRGMFESKKSPKNKLYCQGGRFNNPDVLTINQSSDTNGQGIA
jgi:hypothetical protein